MANISIEKEIQYTGSDENFNLQNELKAYAIRALKWQEEVPDQENPGETKANPITYTEHIFMEMPMANFWIDYKNELDKESNSTNKTNVDEKKTNTSITSVV